MDKLPKELRFNKCGKLVMPFLVVPLLTTNQVKDEDVEWLAEKMVKSNVNGLRTFAFICRERKTIKNNLWPYLCTGADDKWDLRTKNLEYVIRFHRRKAYFNDRGITTVVTFFDFLI